MGLNGERERLSMLPTLRPWLVDRARKFCHGRADAEDLVQDVLVKFMESFPSTPQATEQRCMSWLATTLKNTFISRLRRDRLRQRIEPASAQTGLVAPPPSDPAELPLSERIADADLREAIESLSPKLRDALVASIQGKSYAQIAEELGIKEGAVAKRIFDARKRLNHLLSRGER